MQGCPAIIRRKLQVISRRICILGLLVLLISIVYNWLAPVGIPLITPYRVILVGENRQKVPLFLKRSSLSSLGNHDSSDVIRAISLAEFELLLSEGEVLVLDTRTYTEYCAGHIPGAYSVPYDEFMQGRVDLQAIEMGQKIITYCEGVNCDQSLEVAMLLNQLGYRNIAFYRSGWEEWQNTGKPIIRGCQP